MQFGLFMMPLHPPHRAFADGYDRDVAQIVLADRLGFREVWVGEHLTERWENAPAPDLLLAQALALTKSVRLGTGVPLLALHNPVYLAHRRRRHSDRPVAVRPRPLDGAGALGGSARRRAQALGVGRAVHAPR